MKINEAYGLLKAAYNDWSRFLVNPQYMRNDDYISWNNRFTYMLKHPILASHISYLVDSKQYTFQILEDGSVFQIYYKFDEKGNQLVSARLAFYSSKMDEAVISDNEEILNTEDVEESNNENDLVGDSEFVEYTAGLGPFKDGPVSWLRIEYEPRDARGVLHHDCHMHFSAFPYSRFVVAGVPTPVQFIEFVMAFCYPKIYKEHRLDAQGVYVNEKKIAKVNSITFPVIESIVFSQIAHFRIPANPL